MIDAEPSLLGGIDAGTSYFYTRELSDLGPAFVPIEITVLGLLIGRLENSCLTIN